jgi:hypothetical protein
MAERAFRRAPRDQFPARRAGPIRVGEVAPAGRGPRAWKGEGLLPQVRAHTADHPENRPEEEPAAHQKAEQGEHDEGDPEASVVLGGSQYSDREEEDDEAEEDHQCAGPGEGGSGGRRTEGRDEVREEDYDQALGNDQESTEGGDDKRAEWSPLLGHFAPASARVHSGRESPLIELESASQKGPRDSLDPYSSTARAWAVGGCPPTASRRFGGRGGTQPPSLPRGLAPRLRVQELRQFFRDNVE